MSLTLAIPCRADEPGLKETLESLRIACQHSELPSESSMDLMICINGVRRAQECPPLGAVRSFCARHAIALKEVKESQDEQLASELVPAKSPIRLCTVLLTEQLGKPRAWNTLWKRITADLVVFCDADVRIAADALFHLLSRLQQNPSLRLIAAREVPVLQTTATVWSRMGAIPYRFNFGNAGGRLYLIRKDAFTGEMPEDLLLEDAWLTVAVGKRWVAKEWGAQVFFLPPATWRDYFAERVRSEGGKLQIRRMHAPLLSDGPVARYRWRQFWHGITLDEYPLILLALCVRGLARIRAWIALASKDSYALYRPFTSTKGWVSVER